MKRLTPPGPGTVSPRRPAVPKASGAEKKVCRSSSVMRWIRRRSSSSSSGLFSQVWQQVCQSVIYKTSQFPVETESFSDRVHAEEKERKRHRVLFNCVGSIIIEAQTGACQENFTGRALFIRRKKGYHICRKGRETRLAVFRQWRVFGAKRHPQRQQEIRLGILRQKEEV